MSEIVTLSGENAQPARVPAMRSNDWSMPGIMARLRGFTAQPAVRRALPAIAVLGMVAVAALAWAMVSTPPQRSLFSGMADADKAQVVEALKGAGIAYQVDGSTGGLSVAESDYYQAKMLLAQAGLPKGSPDGDAMISKLPMGASRAVEDQRLRAAREMDLARTIEEIDSVKTARVHLAVEQPSVFLRERSAPAASVMLQLNGGASLSDAQVRAITHLVAASVPGLSPDGVSVVDQNGRLLSKGGSDPAAEASNRQLDIQAQIEQRYVQSLATLLTPLVGAGNFTTEVNADLDFNEVQATRETFPKDTAVATEEGNWTKDGNTPDGAGGIPGALSNQPPAAAQVANTPEGAAAAPAEGEGAVAGAAVAAARTTESYNRTYALGREVSVTKNQVGTLRRLSVAVAIRDLPGGKPRTKAELAAIEQLVQGAVGFNAQRGDMIAIKSRAFAAEPEVSTNFWEEAWFASAMRNVTALLVAALVIFGIGRPLLARRGGGAAKAKGKKGAAATPEERAQLSGELSSAIAREARDNPEGAITLEMIEAAPSYSARADLIRHFVRQDPARAALVVRDLIRADGAGREKADG